MSYVLCVVASSLAWEFCSERPAICRALATVNWLNLVQSRLPYASSSEALEYIKARHGLEQVQ